MEPEIFVYTAETLVVPRDVVRARIDPSVKCISHSAFRGCKQLREVEFNEGLERIGDLAFFRCESLQYVRTPSTTIVVGKGAFSYCKSLKNVLFNEGLIEIGGGAFESCLKLTNVCLPSTMKFGREKSFNSCSQLRHVALNEGLEEVGEGAFSDCKLLRLIGAPISVGFVSPNWIDYHPYTIWEVEGSDKVWKRIHKHVLATANAADGNTNSTAEGERDTGNVAMPFAIPTRATGSRAGGSLFRVNDQERTEMLLKENKKLRAKVAEMDTLKQSLTGMKRKFEESQSELGEIFKKFDVSEA